MTVIRYNKRGCPPRAGNTGGPTNTYLRGISMAIISRPPCSVTSSLFDGKRCTKCGRWSPLSSFGRNPRRKDGLHSQCKSCNSGKGEIHPCQVCGKDFVASTRRTKMCSPECRNQVKPRGAAKLTFSCICEKCSVAFAFHRKRNYCIDCCPVGRVIRVCTWCSETFHSQYGETFYCSRRCYGKAQAERQKGDKSHLWKGGRCSAVKIFRESNEYREWRTAVYTRDNFTCQMCHERGGNLTGHHIKLFSTHPELALVVGNGITLCWPCHLTIKGREADFEEAFFAITGGLNSSIENEGGAK